MIDIQASADRGSTRIDWLDSRHSFSFGSYRNPARTGFGPLLVLNDDRIAPGAGFGAHPHRDMEILTFVTAGRLRHRDNLGHESVLEAGTAQVMHAGTGVVHSEWNDSEDDDVRLLQIWIQPRRRGATPGYAELRLAGDDTAGVAPGAMLRPIATPDGRDGSLAIDQDAEVAVLELAAGASLARGLGADRRLWLQVIEGVITVGGRALAAGDGAGLVGESRWVVDAAEPSRLLVLELPAAD
jgi:redox-sensitive bicupin YhaK (pirin superfamily)